MTLIIIQYRRMVEVFHWYNDAMSVSRIRSRRFLDDGMMSVVAVIIYLPL